jgi:hypothetical protein
MRGEKALEVLRHSVAPENGRLPNNTFLVVESLRVHYVESGAGVGPESVSRTTPGTARIQRIGFMNPKADRSSDRLLCLKSTYCFYKAADS